MRKFYDGIIFTGTLLQHPLLLAMRLFWGFAFFQAGWAKFYTIDSVAAYFSTLSIPLPYLNAYLVAATETLGGLLLIFGLGARLASIPLIITMTVALLTAHIPATTNIINDPNEFIAQKPFLFLLTALLVFAFGPGAFSIDALLKKFFKKR